MNARPATFVALLLLGCAPPAPVLDVHPLCDLPGSDCSPACAGDLCPDLEQLSWCCDYEPNEDGCTLVEALTDCNALNQYAIWCEYGRSTPATFPDGPSGFECFG